MNEFCEYCDNDIEINIYTDTQRFCSEQCRIDYHNTRRKMMRKFDAIDRAVSDLYKMLADDSMSGMHPVVESLINNAKHRMQNPAIHGQIIRVCTECELPNYNNQLLCSCGAKTKYREYKPKQNNS